MGVVKELPRTFTELPFPRYVRGGQCNRCGWCCLQEDPPCEYLVKDGEKYKCTIHNKPRPSHCGIYPGNPPIIHSGCGYYFMDRWNDNKKIMPGEPV